MALNEGRFWFVLESFRPGLSQWAILASGVELGSANEVCSQTRA